MPIQALSMVGGNESACALRTLSLLSRISAYNRGRFQRDGSHPSEGASLFRPTSYTHVAHELRAEYVAGLMESLGNALRRGLATLGHYASELWLKNLTGIRSDLRNHLYLS